jgi:hypothetical protein
LSLLVEAMKMLAKPTRTLLAMFDRILLALSRRWSRDVAHVPAHPWSNEDISWYSSSFELARGLEVIEHRDATATVFVDTLPAFQRAEA